MIAAISKGVAGEDKGKFFLGCIALDNSSVNTIELGAWIGYSLRFR